MARPLRILIPDGYYHITCRGNQRKAIYKDDTDRSAFIDKLKSSLAIYQVELHAYVLMSNHFHLMVATPKGNLSEFMRHFNISYTAAFNRRHRRVGHLYQGRYKAIVIDRDNYLLELSRYVHLNPVRIRPLRERDFPAQIRHLEKYRWSSLAGYLDAHRKESWMTYAAVLGQIGGSRKRYREFVGEGIRSGYLTPWEGVKGQVVLGADGFVERLKRRINNPGSRRELPSLKHLEAIEPAAVLREVARYFGLVEKQLTGKRTGYRDERALAMELLYRHANVRQEKIGNVLGQLDYTSVSRERARLRQKLEQKGALSRALREIEAKLLS
jgi:putative transposase